MTDLRGDSSGLYLKSGLKGIGITFMMTDSHIADEKFLVLISDMLAIGEISELFADDEVDNIVNALRTEVRFLICKQNTFNVILESRSILVMQIIFSSR